jgi:peptidoglycan/xylan/chitin deacetylase (PgdA/CDA1 family)
MRILKQYGYHSVSLERFADWHHGDDQLDEKSFVITFDDGFADFADTAFPILQENGFSATVFLPTGRMGGEEQWEGANEPARPLMTWEQVSELSRQGIEFGGHGVTHTNLKTLSGEDLAREIRQSQDEIAQHLGKPTTTFAPPYGGTSPHVQQELARFSKVSVGTKLGRADQQSNVHDVPRIEMFYFTNLSVWRNYLKRQADWYLSARRAARRARQVAMSLRGGN